MVVLLESYSVYHNITEDLNMQKYVRDRFPRFCRRKGENNVLICRKLLDRLTSGLNITTQGITGDEIFFEYDPETKRQSSELRTTASPWPKKLRMYKSSVKCTLIIFFDSKGVVHKSFVPFGETMDAEFYTQMILCLRKVSDASALRSQLPGFSTMITPHVTHSWKFWNLWPKKCGNASPPTL